MHLVRMTGGLAVVLCILSDPAAPAATPPAWSPPAAPSPLREIWSFDTKG